MARCYKQTGRFDRAIEVLEEALSLDCDDAGVLYQLACLWSLARNPLLSVDYLIVACEVDSKCRTLAAGDPDFDHIRKHPAFLAVTKVAV